MRAQLPQMMRQMTNPQNVQALAQMQSAMQQLQRAGLMPPGMPGLGGMPGVGDVGGTGVGDAGGLGPGLAGLANFGNLNLGGGEVPVVLCIAMQVATPCCLLAGCGLSFMATGVHECGFEDRTGLRVCCR